MSENKSEDKKRDIGYIQKLIANQLNIVHHTERYIFDIAKIASIVLGVISFVGIPNLLTFQSENIFLQIAAYGIAFMLIIYSILCVIVILYAIYSMGGINLNVTGKLDFSPWWYMDENLLEIKSIKGDNERLTWFHAYLEKFERDLLNINTEVFYKRELMTLLFLYLRNEHQLQIARRMKKILLFGIFFALGIFSGAIVFALPLF